MVQFTTFGNKYVDKYCNYNNYVIGKRDWARELEDARLLKLLKRCTEILKKPYLRFMYCNEIEEAACVVYDCDERVTKLIPISQVEQMAEEGKFHK